MSQHITLSLGGQKGAISASSDLGESLFAEVILGKNNTKHGAPSLVTLNMMDGDKGSSCQNEEDNQWAIAAEAVKTKRGLNVQVCR